MGTVPPRLLPPLRQWEQPLAEDVYAGDLRESIEDNGITLEEAFDHVIKSNKWEYLRVQFEHWLSGGFTMRELSDALTQAFGKKRQYIDDGRGGLLSVDDMTPIHPLGKPEPVAYIDKDGRVYHVDDDRLTEQYEDARVEYDIC